MYNLKCNYLLLNIMWTFKMKFILCSNQVHVYCEHTLVSLNDAIIKMQYKTRLNCVSKYTHLIYENSSSVLFFIRKMCLQTRDFSELALKPDPNPTSFNFIGSGRVSEKHRPTHSSEIRRIL